ncbi:hypothetical protein FKM82_021397 [Ascaphus truei]
MRSAEGGSPGTACPLYVRMRSAEGGSAGTACPLYVHMDNMCEQHSQRGYGITKWPQASSGKSPCFLLPEVQGTNVFHLFLSFKMAQAILDSQQGC